MDEYYRTDAVPPESEDPQLWRDMMASLRRHHRHPDRPQWCAAEYCIDTGKYPCWAARHAILSMEGTLALSRREEFRAWADRHLAGGDPNGPEVTP